jgi:hypothetical protein
MEVICCCCEQKFSPNNLTSYYWGDFAEIFSVVLCRSCTVRNETSLAAHRIQYDAADGRNFNHWYPKHPDTSRMRMLLPLLKSS